MPDGWRNISIALKMPSPGEETAQAYENACVCSKTSSLQWAFLSYCLPGYSLLCFFMPRSCSCDLWSRLTAEEPHQPFQVLHCGRQVELLAHEAHPA